MSNQDIAAFFKKLADLLEIRGDNPFRIRAYRNAARTIETSGYDFTQLVAEGADLSKLPDIGERIAKKIEEIVTTGHLKKLEEVQKEFPPGILDLLKIEGIGPKRAKVLYEKLGIGSLEELKKAAEEHRIRELPGFDEKLEEKILKGVVLYKKEGKRFLFAEAEPFAEALKKHLSDFGKIDRVTVAGSYRRRRATVGDLDIVITSEDPLGAMDHFTSFPEIREIVSKGDTRSTVILQNNLQVDLRCVSAQSYGAALHYFTGSKPHNIAVRKMAMERGWKVNEYGVFDQGMQRLAGATEEEIYRLFGMAYIEPELREDRGELQAAMEGTLPWLVERRDLRGDLHLYSSFGLGQEPPEVLVKKALSLGYDYLAICDRAEHLLSSHGRKRAPLDAYLEELDRLAEAYPKLHILKGIEVEILENGSLAVEESTLERVDWVVASADEHHELGKEKQTKRLLEAIAHPAVDLIAHPMGRILGKKNGIHFDLDAVIDAAARHGVALEIDSRPDRLDLDDVHIRRAIEAGASLALCSVAGSATQMERIRYGLYQARRGWAEAKDLLNTLPPKKLLQRLGKKK
ncbi:DNA polymerase/3'-5' exonuclease PolX [Nitratifractor sp.]